jgi:hypothetical protein
MSRIELHSPSGMAQVWGGESPYLQDLAKVPGLAALDLDGIGDHVMDTCRMLLDLSPEPPAGEYSANYLHRALREADAEITAGRAAFADAEATGRPLSLARTSYRARRGLVAALSTALTVGGLDLVVAGEHLHTNNLIYNAALATGSETYALAAKIGGWGSVHLWVDRPDRAWLASIIRNAADRHIFRERFLGGPDLDGNRRLVEVGWSDAVAFLLDRDDEPVVFANSSDDHFPRWEMAGKPPTGLKAFDALPVGEQWSACLTWMRQHQPWLQLTPDSLFAETFHIGVTIYDLLAVDRDDRVRAAAARHRAQYPEDSDA